MTRARLWLPVLLVLGTLSCTRFGPAGPPGSGDDTVPVSLSTSAVAFAAGQAESTIVVTNGGGLPLTWHAVDTASWLAVEPASGTLAPGTTSVALQVNRTGLAPGTYSGRITIVVEGLELAVAVTAEVDARPIPSLDTAAIDLGLDGVSAATRLSNTGNAPLTWSLSGPAWIAVAPAAGTVAAGQEQTITLTAVRSGLAVGTHDGTLVLDYGDGFTTIVVRLAVAGAAHLRVAPSTVDFGSTGQGANVTVTNDGGAPLTWSASSDQNWLGLATSSGILQPGASQVVALSASRQGLSAGTHQGAFAVTSNGGDATVEVTLNVPDAPAPSFALAGRIVDQFTGAGLSGLTVRFDNVTATTDASGAFRVPGTPSSSLENLTISGSGIYTRNTFARATDSRWLAIPASFDMQAFDDVARDYEPRTLRWLQNPHVYIDTRHVGPDPGPQLNTWIAEARANVEGFLASWSNGTLPAQSVTVGSSPPSDDTFNGWIIIRFDDDATHYASASTVGNARTGWGFRRDILYSTISLRFSGLAGASYAATRTAVLGHELGHALGMGHMEGATPSLMTPRISLTTLSTFDTRTGSIVYSRSPGNTTPDTDSSLYYVGALTPASIPSGENRYICDAPPAPTRTTP